MGNIQIKTRPDGAFVFVREGGCILLVHHAYGDRFWSLPGGEIKNEKPFQAAIREAKEETGFDVNIVRCLGIFTYIRKADGTISTVHLFEGEFMNVSAGITINREEIKEVCFVSAREMAELGLGPGKLSIVQNRLIVFASNYSGTTPAEGILSVAELTVFPS